MELLISDIQHYHFDNFKQCEHRPLRIVNNELICIIILSLLTNIYRLTLIDMSNKNGKIIVLFCCFATLELSTKCQSYFSICS